MKTKTKGKVNGKVIIGIAMAAIMLASVFVAIVPMSVGTVLSAAEDRQTITSHGQNFIVNYDNVSLKLDGVESSVIVGQDIQFRLNDLGNTAVAEIVTLTGITDTDTAGETVYSDSNGLLETGGMVTGQYNTSAITNGLSTRINIGTTRMDLDIKDETGVKSISSVAVGGNFKIKFTQALSNNDGVTLKITGPKDYKVNPTDVTQVFNKVNTSSIAGMTIDTDDWDLGTYTLWVETEEEYARGLDKKSNEKTLKVVKGEIAIEAEKTSVAELELVKLTVTGVAGRPIWIGAYPSSANVEFPIGVNDNNNTAVTDHFNHSIDEDSTRTYAVEFNDTGSYTIKVIDGTTNEEDTVDITVTEKAVTFDMPTTVVIGEKLTVKGTSNTGDWVQIAVDDIICDQLKKLVIDENGEFEKEIDTSDACDAAFSVPGSVRLKAFIDKNYSANQDVSDYTDDGSVAILMTRGDLTAELSTKEVAQDDEFTISGTAKGSKEVDLVIVAPKGAGGTTIEPGGDQLGDTKGIFHTSTSVSRTDDTFSKKIDVGANVDTGSYLILVLSKGSDDKYGKLGAVNLTAALADYTLTAKTQEQILTIIEDATFGAAGSDDLMWLGYVKVEAAYVRLDPIASVGIGEPLVVTGTTNRKAGFAIVVTCKGPVELTPQTVYVENGKFNATLDTADATVGTYTVKADDGDGHTDDATVEILTAVPATPTPTPEVVETPAVTPTVPAVVETPTPTPEVAAPTPTPTPGFGAVFAIAGLLAVAYLVLRKRR